MLAEGRGPAVESTAAYCHRGPRRHRHRHHRMDTHRKLSLTLQGVQGDLLEVQGCLVSRRIVELVSSKRSDFTGFNITAKKSSRVSFMHGWHYTIFVA